MRAIFFNFREGVSRSDQKRVLEQIEQITGVDKAAMLKPDSKDSVSSRMGQAYLQPDANPESLRNKLESLQEIESAFVPAERYPR